MTAGQNITQAPFPYLGGKSKLLDWIYSYMPEKIEHLVDVFGGSGSVVLGFPNAQIKTYNDINLELCNFFQCLRDNAEKLIYLIENTPHHRFEYDSAFQPYPFELGDVEAARRTFVKISQSFGRTLVKSGWSNTSKGARLGISESTLKVLSKSAKLNFVWFALKQLQIECLDYKDLFAKYDNEHSFFFLDPPYVAKTRDSGVKYGSELNTIEEHLELINSIKQLKTGNWILCCYDNELYQQELSDFQKVTKTCRTNGNTSRIETMYLGPFYKELQGKQLKMFN